MRVLAHALPCVRTHVYDTCGEREREKESEEQRDGQTVREREREEYGSAAGQRGHKSILMG